jgi:hypothetical protein
MPINYGNIKQPFEDHKVQYNGAEYFVTGEVEVDFDLPAERKDITEVFNLIVLDADGNQVSNDTIPLEILKASIHEEYESDIEQSINDYCYDGESD